MELAPSTRNNQTVFTCHWTANLFCCDCGVGASEVEDTSPAFCYPRTAVATESNSKYRKHFISFSGQEVLSSPMKMMNNNESYDFANFCYQGKETNCLVAQDESLSQVDALFINGKLIDYYRPSSPRNCVL